MCMAQPYFSLDAIQPALVKVALGDSYRHYYNPKGELP